MAALDHAKHQGGENIIGVYYRVNKKIGEGSFGVIFEGKDLRDNRKVAVKFEPRKSDAPQLRDEYRTYKQLAGCKGIPNVYYFGTEGLHNVLVIDLLGPSLEDLFDRCKRRFSIKTTIMVAKQMLSRVQTVHEKYFIYRDIKPDNFLIGYPNTPNENVVHLVDFGMAKHYRDPKTKQHIPYRERKSLSGTARYMSINTHLGREQSRRDDLEALGHVFMYFLRGQLPWQGLKAATNKQKYEKIGEKKQEVHIDDLCRGFPPAFGQYMTYVRNLGFEDTPDYDYLRELLSGVLQERGETEDSLFDWSPIMHERGFDPHAHSDHHGYAHHQSRERGRQTYGATPTNRLNGQQPSYPPTPAKPMNQNQNYGAGHPNVHGQPLADGYGGGYSSTSPAVHAQAQFQNSNQNLTPAQINGDHVVASPSDHRLPPGRNQQQLPPVPQLDPNAAYHAGGANAGGHDAATHLHPHQQQQQQQTAIPPPPPPPQQQPTGLQKFAKIFCCR